MPILTARVPLAVLPERLALYEDGLRAGGHPEVTRARRRSDVAVWRHVYVGDSQAEAEDDLAAAVLHTRGTCSTPGPPTTRTIYVDPAVLNPFNDPGVANAEAVRWSLETGALCGTADRVAEQVAALRAAGVRHLLCQMSFGYLAHDKILASMRRFGERVLPVFRAPHGQAS